MSVKSATEVLCNALSAGIRVWAEGENLRFSAPNDLDVTRYVTELREYKAQIFAVLRNAASLQFPEIQRRSPTLADNPPLSFAQERLWFIEHSGVPSAVNNLSSIFRLKGDIDNQKLKECLEILTNKHEILRACFFERSGIPQQIILSSIRELQFDFADLRQHDHGVAKAQLARLHSDFAMRKFDLGSAPLMRVLLAKMPDGTCSLMLSAHHLICDGHSLGILSRELRSLYYSYPRVDTSPEQHLHHADYSAWQRSPAGESALSDQLAYWRDHLRSAGSIPLPFDHQRSLQPTYRTAVIECAIPVQLYLRCRSLARSEGVTPYLVLLAVFKLLLAKYSGSTDIVLGTPVSLRHRQELQGIVGPLINLLTLRSSVDERFSFLAFLAHLKAVWTDAQRHQDVPFEQIVAALGVKRDPSRHPIFQVMFSFQAENNMTFDATAARQAVVAQEERFSPYDLSLFLREANDALHGGLEYSKDIFDHETAERMVHHFLRLLELIMDAPRSPMVEISLTTDEERVRLMSWAKNDPITSGHDSLIEAFQNQVLMSPELPAVSFNDRTLTYAELERYANCVALAISSHSQPESLVGISCEPCLELVVGVLGILKAGCAYVPIDLEQPQQRLDQIVMNCELECFLSKNSSILPSSLQNVRHLPICLQSPPAGRSVDWQAPRVTRSSLCYVIYTSGSTGRPKGVMVTHGSVLNVVRSIENLTSFRTGQRVLALTPLTFDIASLELFLPLLTGGTLIFCKAKPFYDIDYLLELLRSSRIDWIQSTPSNWQLLVDAGWTPNTQFLLTGGEALPDKLARLMTQSKAQIWNVYGPTEATIWSSAYSQTPAAPVRIGRPLDNTSLYVLDSQLAMTPPGIPGELYIGGTGVARGYFRSPCLTAERFIPDVFGTAGERLYRTGDSARWDRQGNLEYLGRVDYQIKLRGHRIEPGDIETALREHSDVKHALVCKSTPKGAADMLVAYIVRQKTADTEDADVIRHLRERLPAHMIPERLVWLDEFPLSANGKIDRSMLPAPEPIERGSSVLRSKPSGPVQEALLLDWQEALGRKEIGVEDDFFDLGGQSLLAAMLAARLRNRFRLDITVQFIFLHSTIHAQSAEILSLQTQDKTYNLPELTAVLRDAPLPISWEETLFFEPENERRRTKIAQKVLCFRGPWKHGELVASIQDVVARNELLRTSYRHVHGQAFRHIRPADTFQVRVANSLSLDDEEFYRALVECAATDSFMYDLAEHSLFRATFLSRSAMEGVLILTLHHILFDGFSLNLLLNEIHAFYRARVRSVPCDLPAQAIQYGDYAYWQKQVAHRQDEARDYWLRRLDKLPVYEPMCPDDLPKGDLRMMVAPVPIEIQGETARKFIQIAKEEDCTLFMLMLTVFNIVISRHWKQSDTVICCPSMNRQWPQTQNMIGCFINQLPLRNSIDENEGFRSTLRSIRVQVLQDYAHQSIHLVQIVEALGMSLTTFSKRHLRFSIVASPGERYPDENGAKASDPLQLQHQLKVTDYHAEQPSLSTDIEALLPPICDPPWPNVHMSLGANNKDGLVTAALHYDGRAYERCRIEEAAQLFTDLVSVFCKTPDEPLNLIFAAIGT